MQRCWWCGSTAPGPRFEAHGIRRPAHPALTPATEEKVIFLLCRRCCYGAESAYKVSPLSSLGVNGPRLSDAETLERAHRTGAARG